MNATTESEELMMMPICLNEPVNNNHDVLVEPLSASVLVLIKLMKLNLWLKLIVFM